MSPEPPFPGAEAPPAETNNWLWGREDIAYPISPSSVFARHVNIDDVNIKGFNEFDTKQIKASNQSILFELIYHLHTQENCRRGFSNLTS